MIIFDLDGTLADCEHRRHFVDPKKNDDYFLHEEKTAYARKFNIKKYRHKITGIDFVPDWKSFYEACDKDTIIEPTFSILSAYIPNNRWSNIQIWSGRCESVLEKTCKWFGDNWFIGWSEQDEKDFGNLKLKMRRIGDNTPDDELKEKWLDERRLYQHCSLCYGSMDMGCPCKNGVIDFVFDSDPKSIAMYRRRGIFVFNCAQNDEEFECNL
jgi:hypothetical protein